MSPSEEQLRAAFAAKAEDAPAVEDVLAGLILDDRPAPSWRRFRLVAAAAAVIAGAAVGVPAVLHSSHTDSNTAAGGSNTQPGAKSYAADSGAPAQGPCSEPMDIPSCRSAQPPPRAGATPAFVAPACPAAKLTVTLAWRAGSDGLRGTLTVRNDSAGDCVLDATPRITVPHEVVSTVDDAPGVLLRARAAASAGATWTSWCGPSVGRRADVILDGVIVHATVTGPTQPSCSSGGSTTIRTGRFVP